MWKRGETAPNSIKEYVIWLLKLEIYWRYCWEEKLILLEQFLLFSTIFCYLLEFHVKTETRFSLRGKRLFEINEVEIMRDDCIQQTAQLHKLNKFSFNSSTADIWTITGEDLPSDMCAKQMLRSAYAFAQSGQISLKGLCVVNDSRFLQADANTHLFLCGFINGFLKWTTLKNHYAAKIKSIDL